MKHRNFTFLIIVFLFLNNIVEAQLAIGPTSGLSFNKANSENSSSRFFQTVDLEIGIKYVPFTKPSKEFFIYPGINLGLLNRYRRYSHKFNTFYFDDAKYFHAAPKLIISYATLDNMLSIEMGPSFLLSRGLYKNSVDGHGIIQTDIRVNYIIQIAEKLCLQFGYGQQYGFGTIYGEPLSRPMAHSIYLNLSRLFYINKTNSF